MMTNLMCLSYSVSLLLFTIMRVHVLNILVEKNVRVRAKQTEGERER